VQARYIREYLREAAEFPAAFRLGHQRMTTMAAGRTNSPDDATIEQALGTTKKLWDAIVAHLDSLPNGLGREWKYYGEKHGWQVKVTDRKRAVLYLIPHDGSFLAALALNDKAVAALPSQKIPPRLVREIATGKTYPEGRPARVEVTSTKDLTVVKKLLALKLRA
jgi:Protein of unknown function (DUF3788)